MMVCCCRREPWAVPRYLSISDVLLFFGNCTSRAWSAKKWRLFECVMYNMMLCKTIARWRFRIDPRFRLADKCFTISGRAERHVTLNCRGADRHAVEREVDEELRDLRAGEVDNESHAKF